MSVNITASCKSVETTASGMILISSNTDIGGYTSQTSKQISVLSSELWVNWALKQHEGAGSETSAPFVLEETS